LTGERKDVISAADGPTYRPTGVRTLRLKQLLELRQSQLGHPTRQLGSTESHLSDLCTGWPPKSRPLPDCQKNRACQWD